MRSAWRTVLGGAQVSLRVTPNAAADRIEGIEQRDDGAAVLRIRVRSAPDMGKANAAVIALLAKSFDVPKSAVTLISGATARLKTVEIAGPPGLIEARLMALAGLPGSQ